MEIVDWADLDEVFIVCPLEMVARQDDLLHEDSGESDDNTNDAGENPTVPVVARWLLAYPLLVDCAVAGHVVEDLVLKQVLATTVMIMLVGVHDRQLRFLHIRRTYFHHGLECIVRV